MKYRVSIYCRDCYQEDFEGCFDGDSEEIGIFDTKEKAIAAGEERIKGASMWSYTITESEDIE